MTQLLEKEEKVYVCVLQLDSSGPGAELKRTYHPCRNKEDARRFAEKYASELTKERHNGPIRGVFLQDGSSWEAVWSYFDV